MTAIGGFLFVPNVDQWQPPSGRVIHVSSSLRTKRALMGTFRQRLGLPDYFGWNWDALNDVLHGLPDSDEGGVILIHDGVPFSPASRRSRRIYLEILAGLSQSNRAAPHSWTIVFPENCRDEIARALEDSP